MILFRREALGLTWTAVTVLALVAVLSLAAPTNALAKLPPPICLPPVDHDGGGEEWDFVRDVPDVHISLQAATADNMQQSVTCNELVTPLTRGSDLGECSSRVTSRIPFVLQWHMMLFVLSSLGPR
jgi:hypothetical protein